MKSNKMHKHTIAFLTLLLIGFGAQAQEVKKKVINWYNGAKYGMNTDAAYAKVLAGKKSETVIVAVIDSGIDIEHEDLQGHIWVNTDEVAGNGIDDDGNGYIDDVNGWNFLGNAEGENINDVRLEVTRIYASLHPIFYGKEYGELSKEEKGNYTLYKAVKEEIEKERAEAEKELLDHQETTQALNIADKKLQNHFNGNYSKKDLKKAKKDPTIGKYAKQMLALYKLGLTYKDYNEMMGYYQGNLDYNYNPDIDPRSEVIGDNPTDFSETNYGNNDVEGQDAGHGTHCAGIIGAIRNNGIGNNGVADNVQIMSLRAVPNGDEWDKDIALAVRYAVDNGAQIINMSFGKPYSPEQAEVIKSFRYAESKGVLLVHAAGNEGLDNDDSENYPRPQYKEMREKFSNWIEVGASTRFKKAKFYKGVYLVRDGLAADFSNYGDKMVDVFAPGHAIYSTVPQSEYDVYDGTSMAGPMVAGVAALLKSYFNDLTMIEIRAIILASVQKVNITTPLPGDPAKEITFDKLCVTGGIVNVLNAVEMAENYK
ncbi:MAG: peptidase S8 [Crocinitomicaceae bacterium]|nr:peptidase S8 [Crocinitomicaceae bacterium]|tara:strand:+ start:14580 stop:16196 length:1617 start_codon:yes stop_codon:yes gene_type:complete